MECHAFSTSPLNPGVAPTSCFSHVRHCRIRLLASAPGIKFVRNSCSVCSNVVPGGDEAFHNSLRHHSCENSHAVHTVAKASRHVVGGTVYSPFLNAASAVSAAICPSSRTTP